RAGRLGRRPTRPGPRAEPLGPQVPAPQDVYPEVRGVPADVLVYFGDLEWRAVGAVRAGTVAEVFTYDNDTGPDGANHDRTGVFVMAGAPGQPSGRVEGLSLVDVGPSILKMYGMDAPEGAVGRSFL